MPAVAVAEFEKQYLETWTEPDPGRRRANIERMWSPDGRMEISSIGVTLHGIDEIDKHVARVHEDNIVGRSLRFRYDQHATAGDALLLRWSMLNPDDEVAGRGVDLVFLDAEGLVRTVYMFMGVN